VLLVHRGRGLAVAARAAAILGVAVAFAARCLLLTCYYW